ncbi:MAG: UDP-N-acetylmuramate dehydrogenase [Flavobacteriales bacterium]|nr:UDP-N-acetylmuramate dehydrogenase [Flavobacteriales bacterium]
MILNNVSLRPFNTFGIDVMAKALTQVTTEDELREVLEHNRKTTDDLLILGGGSNILFTRNMNGLVLVNQLGGISIVREDTDSVTIRAGAGVVWHELVMHCVVLGWGGIENLSLIPGRVGAAPMQNIGAYGVELREVFTELEALHIYSGELRRFTNEDCQFGYRESVFKRNLHGQYIIISVTITLSKHPKLNISYGAIGEELEKMGVGRPALADVSRAVINIRKSKLPDPAVLGNAGSFFKNPTVSKDLADHIRQSHPDLPSYPANGGMKLAAGWLIEKCGWKGKVVGNTGSHRNQALVLVNYGHATGAEIFQLSEDIMHSVQDTFGVELEREVNVY